MIVGYGIASQDGFRFLQVELTDSPDRFILASTADMLKAKLWSTEAQAEQFLRDFGPEIRKTGIVNPTTGVIEQ